MHHSSSSSYSLNFCHLCIDDYEPTKILSNSVLHGPLYIHKTKILSSIERHWLSMVSNDNMCLLKDPVIKLQKAFFLLELNFIFIN